METDWRKKAFSRIRTLIKEAAPNATEEMKWKKPTNPAGIPVWYDNGMICTGETYKNHLRFTFSKGKSLPDPKGLLGGMRAMIIHEDDKLKETAFKALIREAVALNKTKSAKKSK